MRRSDKSHEGLIYSRAPLLAAGSICGRQRKECNERGSGSVCVYFLFIAFLRVFLKILILCLQVCILTRIAVRRKPHLVKMQRRPDCGVFHSD